MLVKTHLSITLFFVLLFILNVEHKIVFIFVALVATFIPDLDSKFSSLGKKKPFRILQFFIKHRGIMHSFTFLLAIIFFFVFFFPILALPFFLGYGLHLLADSFTVKGIKPFYPFNKKSYGKIRTGGKSEIFVFVFFVLADLFLLNLKVFSIF